MLQASVVVDPLSHASPNSGVQVKSSDFDQPLTSWRPGEPMSRPERVVCDQYENYMEMPPQGLEIDDVELIWWTVASIYSYKRLREKLLPVVENYQDKAYFFFSPIADLECNGRYPIALVRLIQDMLPDWALIPVEKEYAGEEASELSGTLVIQNKIWHALTWAALKLAPKEVLPDHLLDACLIGDLGV
ncbi:MAG: hypothetical protein E7H60_18955 [Pseudomonas oryzihabitans]|uniref:hypothetical protein n=1 Tax=Pseudomonas oryzihabitans TaxID=47885 RepID=UPI0029106210|nr:hypothetical protein [Pseudomonas oryzihabitans]MDU4058624.1 hypothetical protein [Pseudomonas oryzihabitans]